MTKLVSFLKNNRFGVIAWLATAALAASLLGGAAWWKNARALKPAAVPLPTANPSQEAPKVALPLPPS